MSGREKAMMKLIMMMHRRWFGMKTDKDMETLSSPGGSHTSGTEWSMADRSRPPDILKQRQKKNNQIKPHEEYDGMRVVIFFRSG